MNNQNGFTLIELVVVIVILGILAAVAVPKFVNMQTDARVAAVNGLAGSINSAKTLAKAAHLMRGGNTVDMDGTAVAVDTTTGYPTDVAAGIAAAVDFSDQFTFTDGSGFALADYTVTTCGVEYDYTAGGAANVVVHTDGCE